MKLPHSPGGLPIAVPVAVHYIEVLCCLAALMLQKSGEHGNLPIPHRTESYNLTAC